jgi:hypothetical protein
MLPFYVTMMTSPIGLGKEEWKMDMSIVGPGESQEARIQLTCEKKED